MNNMSDNTNKQYQDNSVEKSEFDKLRQIEAEESKLFDSMTKQSEKDKRARIEAEISESRANRWKTF
jgi:predicted DNA binding CopG/RHH family protein